MDLQEHRTDKTDPLIVLGIGRLPANPLEGVPSMAALAMQA